MKLRTLVIAALTANIATSALADPIHISLAHAFGCTSEEYYKKITDMAAQNDREAFEKTLRRGLATGTCMLFQQGEAVFLVETGFLTIKIRRQGDTTEYYTGSDVVSTH